MRKMFLILALMAPMSAAADFGAEPPKTAGQSISLPFKHTETKDPQAVKAPEADTMESGGAILRMVEGLLFCGIALSGLVYFLKKKGAMSAVPAARRMRVIERLQISGKSSLVLVEREGRKLLLAVGSDHVSLVDAEDNQSFIRLDQKELVCDDALELSA